MNDPFKIDEPTCISFSGGRTSAYLLWRVLQSNNGLPDEALVCFANTGKEDEATLQFVHDCETNWGVKIHWLEYHHSEDAKFKTVSFETASRHGEPFAELIKRKNYLPNPVARFCSEELKGKTIERFTGPDVEVMVGIRADEPRRIAKLRARGLLIPLYDAGVTQVDVQSFWKSQPFDLQLAFRNGVTPLGNCDLCFLKGPEQILGLVKDRPDRAVWWAEQEQKIKATFRSDRASYGQMHRFVSDQSDMFNSDGKIDCFCGD
jgi:3'-phosphoadenosine 5'-phosphosulfate sulfotransferase (PAPS reductase)/FAD synthetase